MSSIITTENSPIPIAKMVNDLFMQWLSLPDTRSTLTAALRSVRTNSKMPDPIVYAKVCIGILLFFLLINILLYLDLFNTWWWFIKITTL